MLFLKRIKEKFNFFIITYREQLRLILRILSIIITTIAAVSIFYYHGFPKTAYSIAFNSFIIKLSFGFYLFKYILRFIMEMKPREFIKNYWFEGILMLFIAFDGISYFFFNFKIIEYFFIQIGITSFSSYSILFIQIYFFVIMALESGRASSWLSRINISPSGLLTLSFILLIVLGTILLMMPEMTVHGNISFIDALFTSTSACCVTGLVVVDTAIFFTFKGKLLIMVLIKLGGLNMLSFATFFATFYKKNTGLKYQSLIKDFLNADQLSDSRRILRNILYYSIIIEVVGSILIFLSWNENIHFASMKSKIFFSVFHSISAFNNAGFSLFSEGLFQGWVRYSFYSHFIIAILIILGGMGFSTLQDIFSFKSIRERKRYPWKKLQVNTRIILITTTVLIIAGAVLFGLIENSNTLKEQSFVGKTMGAFFQSVTARTAGFNTVDFSKLSQPALILIMLLMYIGASPGSTGGGIKTTTFFVVIKSVVATIRGNKQVVGFKRTISFTAINKAYSIIIFSITLIFISTFLLTITEKNIDFIRLLFEEISAFGTVGLSTGITPELSVFGKAIIITSMFVGRIGTLTLALALSKKASYTDYKYAKVNVMIG